MNLKTTIFMLLLLGIASPFLRLHAGGQDSLLQLAARLGNAELQVDSLNEWAWRLKDKQPLVALELAREALSLSKSSGYAAGEADAEKRLGTLQRRLGNMDASLLAYQAALRLEIQAGDALGEASVLGNIGNVYRDQRNFALARSYFRQALQINLAQDMPIKALQQYHGIGACHDDEGRYDSAIYYQRAALVVAAALPEGDARDASLAETWNNLGAPYKYLGQLDSAAHYWQMSHAAFTALGDDDGQADALSNLGLLQMENGHPQAALDSFFMPALRLAAGAGELTQQQDILSNIAQAHELAHHPDSALHYLQAYQKLHDALFDQDQAAALANAEIRYQAAEKEAANELLRSEGRRKTAVAVGIGVVALLVMLIAVLVTTYQRKRHRAQASLSAARARADAQRILELVQDQELHSLEALLLGQQQERNRLAAELHDGLGSLLATTKLYVNQIEGSTGQQAAALHKADALIDAACQEVRRYSHDLAGHSVAQFGLLNAVRDLADSISGAGQLQVRVFAHQMEERLPMEMERTLYKVVQELLTNVIKHANATEVTLQLSRLDGRLSLIFEDNGRGMDLGQSHLRAGMGLRSIRARVEGLGGDFHLDSNPGHGTTALIDITLAPHAHD